MAGDLLAMPEITMEKSALALSDAQVDSKPKAHFNASVLNAFCIYSSEVMDACQIWIA